MSQLPQSSVFRSLQASVVMALSAATARGLQGAHCGGGLSARITSGIKSATPVEGPVGVFNSDIGGDGVDDRCGREKQWRSWW